MTGPGDARRLRVLHVIDGLGTGGAERSLAESLPRLRDLGIDGAVAHLYPRTEGVAEVVAAEARVHPLMGMHPARRVLALRRLIERERPDLVHTTLFAATLTARLAVARRVPVLTSIVNTSYEPVRYRDPGINPRALELVRRVDAVSGRWLTAHFHAITAAVKAAAVERLGVAPDRITVIERGRDPERLGRADPQRRATARDALGYGPEHLLVVNAGRQEFQKGQVHLIDAAAAVLAAHPQGRILVAGRRGAATAAIEQAHQRTGAGEKIRLLGHRPDLPELLAAADVFVFPSLFEGLGGTLLEAMALGLPIVASDIPAIREIVEPGTNAVLVPPGDVDALGRALSDLLADPARRVSFGARSRAIFEERFTLDRSVERMADLYRRLVAEREAGAA